MTYGTIKVDTVTFTDAGIDKSVTLSGLVQNPTFSGNVTVTGTLSGVTVTGTTANFTSGNFTNISGGTHTITSGVFAAGSAASPSITFTGDLNTGIYSPGADQVAISTGGSGRLFVDTSGNTLLGSYDNSGGLGERLSINGAGLVTQSAAATNRGLFGTFGGSTQIIGAFDNIPLEFRTNNTERLRITSAGLVGIGTSAPGTQLHINGGYDGSVANRLTFSTTFDGNANSGSGIYFKNFYNNARITAFSNPAGGQGGTLQLQTYNSDVALNTGIVLNSTGNVGIGTTSNRDSTKLDVLGDITFGGNASYYGTIGYNAATGHLESTSSDGAFKWIRRSGLATSMVLDSSGRLLVGTSSVSGSSGTAPYARIQVQGNAFSSTTQGAIAIKHGSAPGSIGANSTVGSIAFAANNDGEYAWIDCVADGAGGTNDYPGRLVFSTTADGASSPTERLRITSAGLVGVGTSAPTDKLTVVGSSGAFTQAAFRINGTTGTVNDDSGLRLYANCNTGVTNWFIGANYSAANVLEITPSTVAGGGTYSTPALALTPAGRVGVGTTSPGYKLHVSGTTGIIKGDSAGASFLSPSLDLYDSTHAVEVILTPVSGLGAIGTYSNHPFAFYTNNAERARIDSSGRLLVGTSSYSDDGTIVARGSSAGAATQSFLILQRGQTNPAPDLDLGVIRFTDAAGSLGAQIAAQCDGGFSWGTNDYPTRLVFSTTADGASSPTERMRISQNGKTQMFANANDNVLLMRSAEGAGTATYLFAGARSATGISDGTVVFGVFTNGNAVNTNGSYTTISDAKLKENIIDAGSQWDDLKAIQIRNWNFKAETGHETHRQIGPIAQELETVCPGLVFETPDRDDDGNETGEVTKGVNQSVLYMKAVKALQEAMERIETLEAKVAALESA